MPPRPAPRDARLTRCARGCAGGVQRAEPHLRAYRSRRAAAPLARVVHHRAGGAGGCGAGRDRGGQRGAGGHGRGARGGGGDAGGGGRARAVRARRAGRGHREHSARAPGGRATGGGAVTRPPVKDKIDTVNTWM